MLKIFLIVLILSLYILSSCVRDKNPALPKDTISDDNADDILDIHTNEQDGTQLDVFDLNEDSNVDADTQNSVECNPFREECPCDYLKYSLCCVVGTETVYECIGPINNKFWVRIEDTNCAEQNATIPCFPDR